MNESLFLNIGDEFQVHFPTSARPTRCNFLTRRSQGTQYFQYYSGEKIAETISVSSVSMPLPSETTNLFDRGDDYLTQFARCLPLL